MQKAAEASKVRTRPLAIAVRTVAIKGGRRTGARPNSGIRGVNPEAPDARLAVAGCEHLDGRVVSMDYRQAYDILADQHRQRCQPPSGTASQSARVARSISIPSRARITDCR